MNVKVAGTMASVHKILRDWSLLEDKPATKDTLADLTMLRMEIVVILAKENKSV